MRHYIQPTHLIITLFLLILSSSKLNAWPAHPLLSGAALRDHQHWKSAVPVQTKTLAQFVIDNKESLASFLATQENWSKSNIPYHVEAPEALSFSAEVSDEAALRHFFLAVRVNPNIKAPLYLHIAPGNHSSFSEINPAEVTTLTNLSGMKSGTYVALEPGIFIDPYLVLATANDEPDYGFDLGLFEDNNTDYGKIYGFGQQTFGNPNLEYSSQAPFHMGFYHEPGIVFKFAPFLHKTFLNYRYNQYRALALFAFQNNEPYWGYRFLGWSMHYLADATMPYHVRPLPGYSTLRMLWVNFKSMLGFEKAQRNAIQLVSNRHTAIEDYLQQRMVSIYQTSNFEDPLYQALTANQSIQEIGIYSLVGEVSKSAFEASGKFDKAVRRGLPDEMVNDPKVEVSQHERIGDIAEYTREVRRSDRIEMLEKQAIERFAYLGMVLRNMLSTFDSELIKSQKEAKNY